MTISLTLGNSGLPFADRGGGYTDLFGEGFLRQALGAPCAQDNAPDLQLHGNHPLYIRYAKDLLYLYHTMRPAAAQWRQSLTAG